MGCMGTSVVRGIALMEVIGRVDGDVAWSCEICTRLMLDLFGH